MTRTPLQIAFDNFPGRDCRNAKHIDLWQVHGESEYHASVEQHGGVAATPEEAIMLATISYLEQCRLEKKKW